MRISDWSSDVCSSDLCPLHVRELLVQKAAQAIQFVLVAEILRRDDFVIGGRPDVIIELRCQIGGWAVRADRHHALFRSEEQTSELQSLMRISYAVFCLKQKTYKQTESMITISPNLNKQ